MAFGKNSYIEVTRPLKHRPKVKVIKTNGTYKIIGDGGLYTPEEYLLCHGGYAESTTPRLKFTDSEQAEIDAAEDRLTRVSTLVDALYSDGRKLYEELRAAYPPAAIGNSVMKEEQAEVIQNIKAQLHELRGRIEHNDKLESHALRKRNAIRQRITAVARERQFPVQFHNQNMTLDDQLSDLEANE